ncbi:MAG: restriction endonuclease subunit S [Planctomycetes bacterium]|nr:restriction endonuclease subunit S [Planctomycetota bacterium]
MRVTKKPISEVVDVNPRIPTTLASDLNREVDFVSMAQLSEQGYVTPTGSRQLGDVLKGYTYFENGDVIIAKITPCMENGKAAFVENLPHQIGFGSTEFHVLRPRDSVDGRYLFYMVWNSEFRNQAEGNMTGSAGQKRVPKAFFDRFEIPLPPLSEQKRIADILDKADAIRRKRQEALKFRNQFLKSTFLEMFGDPATNPYNLPLRELCEFYVNQKDGTKCGPFGGALKKEEYVPAGIPVWNMDNISDDGCLVPNIRLWISQEKYEDLSSYSVKDGDVIISRAGTVGKMCVVRAGLNDSIISTNLIRLRLNASLIPEFFVSLMVFLKGRAGRLKTGPDGAFTHMSTGVLDKLTFPYPCVSAQRDYVLIMEQMDCLMLRLTTAVHEADCLFNSLAQRAFNGDL